MHSIPTVFLASGSSSSAMVLACHCGLCKRAFADQGIGNPKCRRAKPRGRKCNSCIREIARNPIELTAEKLNGFENELTEKPDTQKLWILRIEKLESMPRNGRVGSSSNNANNCSSALSEHSLASSGSSGFGDASKTLCNNYSSPAKDGRKLGSNMMDADSDENCDDPMRGGLDEKIGKFKRRMLKGEKSIGAFAPFWYLKTRYKGKDEKDRPKIKRHM